MGWFERDCQLVMQIVHLVSDNGSHVAACLLVPCTNISIVITQVHVDIPVYAKYSHV